MVRTEARTKGEVDPAQKLELSDQIRRGELDAFVVIPPTAIELPSSNAAKAPVLEFHSDNPNDDLLRNWLTASVNAEVRSQRLRSAGIDQSIADRIDQPLAVDNLGLFERDTPAEDGETGIKAAQKVDPIRTFVVPAVLMFAMFFVIMTSSPQLLNSVLEEKMSKISEVLLGSITPFELMMGKLLGNAGVAHGAGCLVPRQRLRRRGVLRLRRHRLAHAALRAGGVPARGDLAVRVALHGRRRRVQ